jgi:NaMN:DMB phosphoribosyltransferase
MEPARMVTLVLGGVRRGKSRYAQSVQEPLLDLRMRFGEGTGAALAFMLIRAAVAAFTDMATFSSAGVSNRSDLPDSVG